MGPSQVLQPRSSLVQARRPRRSSGRAAAAVGSDSKGIYASLGGPNRTQEAKRGHQQRPNLSNVTPQLTSAVLKLQQQKVEPISSSRWGGFRVGGRSPPPSVADV